MAKTREVYKVVDNQRSIVKSKVVKGKEIIDSDLHYHKANILAGQLNEAFARGRESGLRSALRKLKKVAQEVQSGKRKK